MKNPPKTIKKWFPTKAAMRAWKQTHETPMISRTWKCVFSRKKFVMLRRLHFTVVSVVASPSRTTGRDGFRYVIKQTEKTQIQSGSRNQIIWNS